MPGKDCEQYCLGIGLVLPGYRDKTAVLTLLENVLVTKLDNHFLSLYWSI